jgi:hypothetical protein
MTPGRQGTPQNLSFFNDKSSKMEIEINDSKFQSSDKKNAPIGTQESQHKYSDEDPGVSIEAKFGIRRANTETNDIEGEKQDLLTNQNKLTIMNHNPLESKSSVDEGNMQGDFSKNQVRSRPSSFIGYNPGVRVTYSKNQMSNSQPRTTETYVLTDDRSAEGLDDAFAKTQNSDTKNVDKLPPNISQKNDQIEQNLVLANTNVGRQIGKFTSSQSVLFTSLLDIIYKADSNTCALTKNLRQSADRFGNFQSTGDSGDQITVRHGLMQPTSRFQMIEDTGFSNRVQISQNQRFVLSQNNLNMSDNDQRRNTEIKTGVQYTHVISQPRMTSCLDSNNQVAPVLDFKTLITGAENDIRRRQTDALHSYKSNSVRREDSKTLNEHQQIPPSSEFINYTLSRN